MNKNFIKLLSVCLLCVICFTSCERYPIRALLGVPDRVNDWPDPWYIYDDEIKTKGSMEPFRWKDDPSCADWDKARLKFDSDGAHNGTKCMSLSWVGNSKDLTKAFFGFGLMATEYYGGIVNLSNSGYKNLKFWIKGKLNSNCIFEISVPKKNAPGNPWVKFTLMPNEITDIWQEMVVPIPNVEYMSEIEYDISIGLVASGITNGGVVYLDDIRFCKN